MRRDPQGELVTPQAAASQKEGAVRGSGRNPEAGPEAGPPPALAVPHRGAADTRGAPATAAGRSPLRSRSRQEWVTNRALVVMALVVLITFNVALVFNLVHMRADALEGARDRLAGLGQTVREHAEATVARINVVLADTAELIAVQSVGMVRGDPGIYALLGRQTAQLPMVRALIVTDAQGQLVHDSTILPPMMLDLSDRDYFLVHLRNPQAGLFVGRPVRGRTSGRWFVSMSRRIGDASGAFAGVITAIVDPTALNTAYEGMRPREDGAITLYRDDGTVLLRSPDYERFIGTDQAGSALFTEVLGPAEQETQGGYLEEVTGIDGRVRMMSWGRSAEWPLVTTVSISRAAVLAPWRASLPYHLAAMGGVSVLVLALVWRVWRQIQTLGDLVDRLSAREQDLIAAHQASELASRAKTQFLANMSHELRTPLNAVIGFADMLAGGAAGPLSARQREYAQDIHLSAMHLLDLINDILDVSKIESGTYDLHEGPVNLAEIVRLSERMLRGKAREKRLILDPLCLDDHAWIMADERAVRQIVLNLLSNAIKFTPDQGHITVAVGLDHVGTMTLQVTDSGIGIPEDQLDLVLEPFHQVDSSDTRRHDGTGLGLPLAKALTEQHGGSLRLDSRPGQGTRVTVTFPADRVLDMAGAEGRPQTGPQPS